MFSTELLNEMIRQGYLSVQKHPKADLFIYNYTAKAQYERVWNEVTLQCRGLITDKEGRVVARPFKKFFNLGEQADQLIPQEPFEVYEKMDGSLGILYWLEGEPFIATRGSFAGDQALKATAILRKKFRTFLGDWDITKTYLFEIIYPENRIVVDYGATEDLILLAVIDTQSGLEAPLVDVGFPVVKRYDGINDISGLAALEETNREGFVVKFKSGLRYKVKFAEYQRLHRIITQVSNVSIWEFLKEGQALDELLDRVPDEFYSWVKKSKTALEADFASVEAVARHEFKVLEDRKKTALYFQKCTYPDLLFCLLDGKEKVYQRKIWDRVRPAFSKPFALAE